MRRRDVLGLACAAAAASFAPRFAFAQSAWPAGNVTLVSPFTPGGMSDVLGRALGEKLAPVFGRQSSSRTGRRRRPLGATSVARAAPDGHTLWSATSASLRSIRASMPTCNTSRWLRVRRAARAGAERALINPKLPVHNIAELIAYAKANPGQLNFSSAGIGGAAHIAMAAFNVATGTKMVHVPYRGTPPSITDVISGQVQATFTSGVSLLPHVRSGALRALGSRPQTLPRAGHSGHRRNGAGLRGVVVVRHRRARRHARADRAAASRRNPQGDGVAGDRRRLNTEGAEHWDVSPEEFRSYVAAEIQRWKGVIEAANIKIE